MILFINIKYNKRILLSQAGPFDPLLQIQMPSLHCPFPEQPPGHTFSSAIILLIIM